eukprot:CAMPEP_0194362122 /NCGR_PEP_ID=MMETSP0174-20130528/9800_1 /TAXON_ID=216777 /ORGANISM="Proboscia alata, Strain PI-D3" /LENGTH=74 /DNA_ID=CAMNT_0039134747 /DNA_START=123 /DNA_END=347 /DNA_ORIENTATION=+
MTDNQNSVGNNRVIVTFLIAIPALYFYWDTLLDQMNGDIMKASLVVMMGIAAGCIDLNENMTGQPEGAFHDHDD